jgi:subtilisin-like proprotein convertase family protein
VLLVMGLAIAPAAVAKTKTVTVQNPAPVALPAGNSSGMTFLPGVSSSAVTIPNKGKVLDVNVGVQLTHPHTFNTQLYLMHGSRFVMLESGIANGPSEANYGGGTGCAGGITTFDDSAGQFLSQGTNPFAGTFRPSFSIDASFIGDTANGVWQLLAINNSSGGNADPGTINCVVVTAQYTPKAKGKQTKK